MSFVLFCYIYIVYAANLCCFYIVCLLIEQLFIIANEEKPILQSHMGLKMNRPDTSAH